MEFTNPRETLRLKTECFTRVLVYFTNPQQTLRLKTERLLRVALRVPVVLFSMWRTLTGTPTLVSGRTRIFQTPIFQDDAARHVAIHPQHLLMHVHQRLLRVAISIKLMRAYGGDLRRHPRVALHFEIH